MREEWDTVCEKWDTDAVWTPARRGVRPGQCVRVAMVTML